jgi:hypothetical protein
MSRRKFSLRDVLVRSEDERPGSLSRLAYVSNSAGSLSEKEWQRLVEQCDEQNKRMGISGFLLFSNGRFFQLLEGPSNEISGVWKRIKSDNRHSNVILVDYSVSIEAVRHDLGMVGLLVEELGAQQDADLVEVVSQMLATISSSILLLSTFVQVRNEVVFVYLKSQQFL